MARAAVHPPASQRATVGVNRNGLAVPEVMATDCNWRIRNGKRRVGDEIGRPAVRLRAGSETHAQRGRSIYGRGLGAESDETRFSADLRTTRSLLLVGLDRRASRGSPTTRYAGRRARRSRPTTDLPGRAGCPPSADKSRARRSHRKYIFGFREAGQASCLSALSCASGTLTLRG